MEDYDEDDAKGEDEEPAPLSFPRRLMLVLDDEANKDIIHWLPHGKGFVIADKKKFASDVLPKHFSRKSKFTSFTRKLNRWNFTRVTRGPEAGAYYHPQFQRGEKVQIEQMSCISAKAPQQYQPMSPVALGMGLLPPYMVWQLPAPGSDGKEPPRLTEQQQQQFFQYMQHQQFMAMAAANQQREDAPAKEEEKSGEEGSAKKDGKNSKEKDGDSGKTGTPDQSDMMAFQQQQYYAMMIAQQQQYAAAMAAGAQHQAASQSVSKSKEKEESKAQDSGKRKDKERDKGGKTKKK